MRLKAIISLWISLIVLGNCEHRADYLNWSRKIAKFCKYVKYSEESKRYECGPKLGEFYTYIIIHPDYILPKNPIYPLVAYDGNDNVVMVGGNGKGQIWRMIKFEKWAFVRETKTGMKEVYYDEEEKAFIGLEIGDNKENIKSKAWWSKDGGKSWVRARVPLFNKKKENNSNSVLSVPPVVELTPKVAPTPVGEPEEQKTPVLKPLAPTLVVGPTAPPKPFVAPKPKLPVGGIAEAVGGGYAVAIGKVGGKPSVWRSEDKVPRDWKLTDEFSGGGILPDSLTELSQLKGVEFKGGKFQIRDEEGQGWTYEDTKNEWELTNRGGFGGGSGTVGDPYQIANARHLWLVRGELNKNFKLTKDLDLSVITEEEGFDPIGEDRENPFTGTFDGNGKVIRKLMINRPGKRYVGLFGGVGGGGVVKDIGLEDVNVEGKGTVGGLVGSLNDKGMIENSYATGNVEGNAQVGGLVGTNSRGTIKNSYTTGNVTGASRLGGLVGWNSGTIKKSYATGGVTGNGNNVGGLVGMNTGGTIEKSYATGNVRGKGDVGGLLGYNSGTIENSCATGGVTGNGYNVGGLVGWNNEGTIENSYATGNVGGWGKVGGLVGFNDRGTISGKNYWKERTKAKGVGSGSGANVERKTDAELKALNSGETGWNKDQAIWDFKPGEYPKLR